MQMAMESDNYLYTTGGVATLLHRRWIGAGGFGDVHEVDSIMLVLSLTFSCMTFVMERSADFPLLDLHSGSLSLGNCCIFLESNEMS